MVFYAYLYSFHFSPAESEPLIPADTPFVLKTNGSLGEAAGELPLAGGSGFNAPIIEGYFARPEVLKAYREQSMIETPEFTDVKDVALGSRLRQRPGEDVCSQRYKHCVQPILKILPEQ